MSDKASPRDQRPAKHRDPGLHALGLGRRRDGLVRIPPSYQRDKPSPLMVLLHGAGGDAKSIVSAFQQETDAVGALLLAPDSRGRTWDAVLGRVGPDVEFLQSAVDKVLGEFAVHPDRVALAGFSDGASYALSVGLRNGDLFRHILAFSPGFVMPLGRSGKPRIFISHGTADSVLPIDMCSRSIHPQLLDAGYEVLYREFSGGHTVPPDIVGEAVSWWLAHRSDLSPPASP
jgi:phospholipase/carboxylesterase